MPKIVYISSAGAERVVEVPVGLSAMEGAVQNLVPGIDGDCGGAAACGTCHVHVDAAWLERTGPATPGLEQEMLSLSDVYMPSSRLSCQIKMTDALDGLVLNMPKDQH